MNRLGYKSFYFLLVFFAQSLYGFEKYDHLDGLSDPTSYVEGCVNVLTGAFVYSSPDLVVDGPEEISFIRNYNSFNCFNESFATGFTHNHPTGSFRNEYNNKTRKKTIFVDEKSGNCLKFSKFGPFRLGAELYHLDDEHISSGLTNTYAGIISGRTNLKNCKVFATDKPTRIKKVLLGDGTVRNYNSDNRLYLEIRPSGNKVSYSYYKGRLVNIKAYSADSSQCIGWMNFTYNSDMLSSINTSDGKSAKYICEKKRMGKPSNDKLPFLVKLKIYNQPGTSYCYTKDVHKHKPKYSDETTEIYFRKLYAVAEGISTRLSCKYDDKHRVQTLYLPGTKGLVQGYKFFYSDKTSSTVVTNPLNGIAKYTYFRGRVNTIAAYSKYPLRENNCYRTQHFLWGSKRKTIDNRGNLILKSLSDGKGEYWSATKYTYDEKGNVLEETLHGNLTGLSGDAPLSIIKSQIEGSESYQHKFTYSNDGLNLMLSHEGEDGIREEYQYIPGINRVSQVMTRANGEIIKRQFYQYNHFMAQVSVREDNGSSSDENDFSDVTCSMVQVNTLIEELTLPGFGKPQETIEGYLSPTTGEIVQLKRKVFTYGDYHQVTSETLYDADDKFCYTLTYDYDSLGRCIRETDFFGVATVYKYNTRNCCIFAEKEGSGVSTTFKYDNADRLVEKKETHESGEEFVYSFKYDAMGNVIEEKDAYGNVKKMTYDTFGRHISTEYPPVPLADGTRCSPIEEMGYDIFDRVVEERDPLGNLTKKKYTARGQLAEIEYPDGTSEKYVYNLNGSLHQKFEKNGTYNIMVYDDFQQLVKEETYSVDKILLRSKEYSYERGQLVCEIDASGTVTEYQYDLAGRMIGKRVHGETSLATETYDYDSLGRLCQTKQWLSVDKGEYINHIKEFDFKDRVTLDKTEDHHGNMISCTAFSYDINGNCIEECSWQDEEMLSVAIAEYTSFGLPLVTIDPMGNSTRYHYDFGFENPHGQKVFRSTVTDPKGIRTIVTKDVLGRDVEISKENSQGTLLFREQFSYDLKGNKTHSRTDSIVKGISERIYEVEWEYDSMDRVIRVIEDPKEKSKETCFTYHPMGMLETKCKPDGVILSYLYDSLGRECEMTTSDQSIHYIYQYNNRDQLIRSEDLNSGKKVEREYDGFGNLIEEVLPSGMRICFEYDPFFRIVKVLLPDGSFVNYTYDLARIVAVSRFSPDGREQYTHQYQDADMQGRSLESELITGDVVKFEWDLNGRLKTISSPHFQETIPDQGYDSVGNLLQADYINGGRQFSHAYFYDDLNQLIHESTISEHNYRYDSLHNRLSKNSSNYTVNTLNQVEECETSSYQFDLNGNLITQESSEGKTVYTYDALNRLSTIERVGEWRIEHHYDSFGRRVGSRRFSWFGDWVLDKEREYLFQGIYELGYRYPGGDFQELRVMGKREGPAFRTCVAFELDGEVYAPLYDHIFNVVALVGLNSGNLEASYRYSAFGEKEMLISSEVTCPWLFSNQRYDSDSDLYHFGKRDYRPSLGRWISPDPGDFIDGMNLYAYTRNCPTIHLDFYGYSTHEAAKRPVAFPVYGGLGCGGATNCVLKNVGSYYENLAHHALPESPQRFFLEGMGRMMQGESFVPQEGFVLPSVSDVVPGRSLPGIRVRLIPGIMTSKESAQASAEKISKYLGGAEVYWTCQQSRGLVQDLALCLVEMMHIETPAIQHLSEQIKNDYHEMQAIYGDNFLLCYVDHSRGGLDFYEATKDLPRKMRDVMSVLTLGSAKILNRNDYGIVDQKSNIYDLVTQIAILTSHNLEGANFQYSDYSSGNPLSFIMDHFIESEGYVDLLKAHCESILRQ